MPRRSRHRRLSRRRPARRDAPPAAPRPRAARCRTRTVESHTKYPDPPNSAVEFTLLTPASATSSSGPRNRGTPIDARAASPAPSTRTRNTNVAQASTSSTSVAASMIHHASRTRHPQRDRAEREGDDAGRDAEHRHTRHGRRAHPERALSRGELQGGTRRGVDAVPPLVDHVRLGEPPDASGEEPGAEAHRERHEDARRVVRVLDPALHAERPGQGDSEQHAGAQHHRAEQARCFATHSPSRDGSSTIAATSAVIPAPSAAVNTGTAHAGANPSGSSPDQCVATVAGTSGNRVERQHDGGRGHYEERRRGPRQHSGVGHSAREGSWRSSEGRLHEAGDSVERKAERAGTLDEGDHVIVQLRRAVRRRR